MKKFLFTLISIGLIYSCHNSTKKQSTNNHPIHKSTQDKQPDIGKLEYLEIKQQFDQGYYVDLERLIIQFYQSEYNSNKKSSYHKRVRMMEKEIKANRKNSKNLHDSLSHLSLREHINGLDIPKLDSITSENYDLRHSYTLDFCDINKDIFETGWDENWYLSKQPLDSFICVSVCHFCDCINSVALYSLNEDKTIGDSIELYENGCY